VVVYPFLPHRSVTAGTMAPKILRWNKGEWDQNTVLRFEDDIAIVAQDETNLNVALESLDDILKCNYKMKSNRKKQNLWFSPKVLKISVLKWMTTP
jgi:hypothetical protein